MSVFFSSSRSTFPNVVRLATRCSAKLAEGAAPRHFATLPSRRPQFCSVAFRPSDRGSRESRWHTPRRCPPGVRYVSIFDGSILKHYVDLPPNYKDETGLPFRRKDLDQAEVLHVFGPGTNIRSANKLLRILHGRRVAGTLEDPAVFGHTSQFRDSQISAALTYLRKTLPVDEIANAGLRAEDELRELEEAAENAGEESGQDVEHSNAAEEEDRQAPASKPTDDVYGEGAFDKIRARNLAKREEEERRLEEERKKQEEEESQNVGGLAKADPRKRPDMSVQMKDWQTKGQSALQEPPKMSKWARLAPCTAFVLVLVGGLAVLSEYYTPPKLDGRLFPSVSPAAATVLTLMAANVLVFVGWRIPPLYSFFNRWFILVAATPRPLALLGATFSHQQFYHLFVNMAFLWFFGTRLHDEVGRGTFLAIYLASGSLGFLTTLTSLVLRGNLHLTTLGASGGIYGISTAYFWMHKFESFKVFGLPPDPYQGVQGLGFIGLLLSLNILALLPGGNKLLDVASHLGGMGVGLVCGELVKRRLEAKAKAKAERQKGLTMTERIIGQSGR